MYIYRLFSLPFWESNTLFGGTFEYQTLPLTFWSTVIFGRLGKIPNECTDLCGPLLLDAILRLVDIRK